MLWTKWYTIVSLLWVWAYPTASTLDIKFKNIALHMSWDKKRNMQIKLIADGPLAWIQIRRRLAILNGYYTLRFILKFVLWHVQSQIKKNVFQNEKKPWSKNRTKRVFKGNIVSIRGWKVRNASRDIAPTFLTKRKIEVRGQHHSPAALSPGKNPGTHWTGNREGFEAGLDGFLAKSSGLAGFETQAVQPVAESVYHRHYSDSSSVTC
jgi:ribosomal protein L28